MHDFRMPFLGLFTIYLLLSLNIYGHRDLPSHSRKERP